MSSNRQVTDEAASTSSMLLMCALIQRVSLCFMPHAKTALPCSRATHFPPSLPNHRVKATIAPSVDEAGGRGGGRRRVVVPVTQQLAPAPPASAPAAAGAGVASPLTSATCMALTALGLAFFVIAAILAQSIVGFPNPAPSSSRSMSMASSSAAAALVRQRAKATILGGFVADAATMPLHWIYVSFGRLDVMRSGVRSID